MLYCIYAKVNEVMKQEHTVIARLNLSQQIADLLEGSILTSPSNLSKKIPSEQKLAAEYQVSRPVIREALQILQERGLIVSRNSSGCYVTKPKSQTVSSAIHRLMQMEQINTEELYLVRATLELAAVKEAALHATDSHIALMKRALDAYERSFLIEEERVVYDKQFHMLIAQSSGNTLLKIFVEVLISLLGDYFLKGLFVEGGFEDGKVRHRAILKAIEDHDMRNAEEAMRNHLKVSMNNIHIYDEQRKMHDVSSVPTTTSILSVGITE